MKRNATDAYKMLQQVCDEGRTQVLVWLSDMTEEKAL
jgi:hypothetical protein